MKTFLQWVESKKFDLSILTDTEEGKEDGVGGFAEKLRHNISANYPALYRRGQYPDLYHMSLGADHGYKLGPGQKVTKVPDTAAK